MGKLTTDKETQAMQKPTNWTGKKSDAKIQEGYVQPTISGSVRACPSGSIQGKTTTGGEAGTLPTVNKLAGSFKPTP